MLIDGKKERCGAIKRRKPARGSVSEALCYHPISGVSGRG